MAAHRPGQLVRRERLRAAQLLCQATLVRIARADEEHGGRGAATRRRQVAQRGDHQEPERPGPEDRHEVPFRDRRPEHGVHRARHGLHRDGVGVAEPLGHRVELAGVGHESRRRPPATGVRGRTRSAGRGGCGRKPGTRSSPRSRPGTPGRAVRCHGPRTRAPAAARPACPRPTWRRRRRRTRGRRCRPLRGPARTGTTRCPRSTASCARPGWPGRIRRCPTTTGPRAPTPRRARSAQRARPAAAARRPPRDRSRGWRPFAPRRSAATTARRGACSPAHHRLGRLHVERPQGQWPV